MVNGGWAGAPVKTPIPLERFPFKLTRTEWRRSGAAPAEHSCRSDLIDTGSGLPSPDDFGPNISGIGAGGSGRTPISIH